MHRYELTYARPIVDHRRTVVHISAKSDDVACLEVSPI